MTSASGAWQFLRTRWAWLACAALLALFALLSWAAVRTKNATADEPLHALAGYVKLFHGDFRIDAEDPPLAFYWAMAPHDRQTLRLDFAADAWKTMVHYLWSQWDWVVPTLYRTPGNDADRFITRSRAMMLPLGVVLGALIAIWAGRLGGATAAVSSTALFALDPNFLAHAPLVKNDVPLAMLMIAALYAAWRAGERLTVLRALALALLAGAAVNTKFSGLIFGPIIGIVLIARALLERPWIVPGRILTTRASRLAASSCVLALCAVVSYGAIWLCYGLRYAPTPDPDTRLNIMLIAKAAARNQIIVRDGIPDPSEEQMQAEPPSTFTRCILWADRNELLPQSWLAGLLNTHATTMVRRGYLLGDVQRTGWWYYFPLAMVFKTPLTTLATMIGALAFTLLMRRRNTPLGIDRWAIVCFAVPVAIYGWSLLTSNLNLGLRHALPLYPIFYVLAGIVIARLWAMAPRATGVIALALLIGLAAETLTAHPNYIAFFNVASGGARGGKALLGDSNLDWGQDLKLLADWQRANPDRPLYLCYFGGVDPLYYVRAVPLLGTNPPDLPQQPPPPHSAVIAISATHLQGIYLDRQAALFYQELERRTPLIDVLGGTIYLFDWAPARSGR